MVSEDVYTNIGACRAVCMDTWERLGYTAFDAQLWKLFFFNHYNVHYTYVCACVSTHMQSLRPVLWYEYA